jgi:hypothetical protein
MTEKQLVKQRHRQELRERNGLVKQWTPRVQTALRQQITPVIDFMEQFGPVQTLAMVDTLLLPEPVAAVLTRLYASVGTQAANSQYGYLLHNYPEPKSRKAFGFNRIVAGIMRRFVQSIGGKKITSITETERKRVKRVLSQGIAQQQTNQEIRKALRSPQLTDARARVITRTEVGAAQMEGSRIGATRSRLLLRKVWSSAQNIRTRRMPRNTADHLTMNGVSAPMEGMFEVPSKNGVDLMRQPCDATAPADQVINCRCSCVYVPVRDGNGRVIRLPALP